LDDADDTDEFDYDTSVFADLNDPDHFDLAAAAAAAAAIVEIGSHDNVNVAGLDNANTMLAIGEVDNENEQQNRSQSPSRAAQSRAAI
jgi:hypothetical protein